MEIREDFQNYWDGNGLLCPNPILTKCTSGSDNGLMYCSEFYVMLKKLNLLTVSDKLDYCGKIEQCIDDKGMLNRVPVGQNDGQEGPDDYLGVLNGCRELGNTTIPRNILWTMIRYLGFLNNVNPGVKTWDSFLIRQPQLLAATINAAFSSFKNPLHWLIRFLAFPFYFVAAISIAISCINTPTNDTDSRRLAWHLQNNVKKNSLMCYLASLIWTERLYRHYPKGMQDVAAIYYKPQGNNPYQKWWQP